MYVQHRGHVGGHRHSAQHTRTHVCARRSHERARTHTALGLEIRSRARASAVASVLSFQEAFPPTLLCKDVPLKSHTFKLRLGEALGCPLPGLVLRARSHAAETRTFATCLPFGFDRACSWSNVDFEPSPKLKMRSGTCMVCRLACRRLPSRFDV